MTEQGESAIGILLHCTGAALQRALVVLDRFTERAICVVDDRPVSRFRNGGWRPHVRGYECRLPFGRGISAATMRGPTR